MGPPHLTDEGSFLFANGIAKINVNKYHKASKGCQQTTLGDATLALHHANLLNVLMAIEKMMEPSQLTFLYIYMMCLQKVVLTCY